MESKKINQLATELSPDLSDLTIIGDPTTGISKKITLSQMASLFTGTVEEYANLAAFPITGVADTIYVAKDTNVIYRWDSTAYVILSPNIINSLVFSDANGFDGTISLVGSVATLSITTALTLGSVPFIGASGALTQDNSNLFFDDTNNRLGIATASPTTALDVFGSGIIGRLNATSTNNAYLGFASNGTNKWSAGNVQSDHRFRIFSEANSAELITILQTGEFGIGISNPTTKFHIDGAATALIANLDANVSVAKSISFRSDNSSRINLEVSGTESGSNVGADLFIRTFTDAGSLIETPLSIVRSTGVTTIKSLTLTNVLSVGNGGTGASSYTSGSILFSNGTLIAQDNTKLFWDDTNNRLGIGTNIPTYPLDIVGIANFQTQIYLPNGSASAPALRFNNSNSGLFLPLGVDVDAIAFATVNTERSRITSAGYTKASNTGTYLDTTGAYHELRQSASGTASLVISASNASFTNNVLAVGTTRAASSAFNLIAAFANDFADLKFVVRGDGNVGIKCTPDYTLDVNGVTNFRSQIYLADGTAAAPALRFNNANIGLFLVSGSDTIGFSTGNTERMRLTSSGYLKASNDGSTYVSLASPYTEFTNTANSNCVIINGTHASLNTDGILRIDSVRNTTNNSYYALTFYHGGSGTYKFRVADSGNVTNTNNSYGPISDIKLKENIVDASPKLDDLMKVRIVNYNLKADLGYDSSKQIGVIAQELEQVFAGLVDEHQDKDREGNDLGTTTKSVKMSVFVPMLIKAMQEQQAQIEELKSEINILKIK